MSAEPFLKWAGGKRKLADEILKRLQLGDLGTYVEPFLGGGAVLFEVRKRFPSVKCIVSDKNEEIINLYKVVRDTPKLLVGTLQSGKYVYDKEVYYGIRAEAPTHPIERAARTIYLNRAGYNGMYRVSSKGNFNIPFGKYKNPTICDEAGILAAGEALRGVAITHGDFSEVTYPEEAFCYFDPPYLPTSKTADFTEYAGKFDVSDQRRLALFAGSLLHKRCRVVLSNSDMPLIRDLYGTPIWRIDSIDADRNLSCKGEGRKKVSELLIVGRTIQ